MRTRLIAIVAATAGLAASGTGAGLDDLSADPHDRAAILALPSVYRVEARVEVPALRTRDGTTLALPPGGRVITERGTGFAVSSGGVLVTAAHVAAPNGRTLALSAAPIALAARGQQHSQEYLRDWVERTGARPVGARTVSIRVWPALPDDADPGRGGPPIEARLVPGGVDQPGDLALLRVPRTGVPALRLHGSETVDVPVVVIGFGQSQPFADTAGDPPVPSIREGSVDRIGTIADLPGQRFTVVSAPVENGDSGGPAVDERGYVHGVVRFRYRDPSTGRQAGIVEQPSRVTALLARVGVTNGRGASATAFEQGMSRLWALDGAGARAAFAAALAAYPQHTLAARQLQRATALQTAPVRLEATRWRRGLFLGGAVLAALACAACVALLARAGTSEARATPRGGRRSASRQLD